ncbi:hypothetical protein GF382_03395 [Candidatus Falkowbacteria bacterium]|nr:hypothetical protein [Candidatus Falkowbacteria bacterium]
MKFILDRKKLDINPDRFLRSCGYAFILDRRRDQPSYVRRLTRQHYPRIHMYVDEKPDRIVFNLHLDHKQASYKGAHMHNAEYEGEIVENEVERLKDLLRAEAGK